MGAFDYFTMTFVEELALVATETTVVKKAITKSLARTQLTAAKKKKAKKAAKKPKAKKAKKAKKPKKKKKKKKKAKKKKKKRKKKKAKKVRFVGGKRRKGQHKSKAMIAAGKKNAAAQEEGHWPLQAGVVLGRPLEGHGHQRQGDPRCDHQGGVGVHQEEGAEQGPQRRQDRRHLRRRLHVQAHEFGEQAHQVSGCVFRSPVISTP